MNTIHQPPTTSIFHLLRHYFAVIIVSVVIVIALVLQFGTNYAPLAHGLLALFSLALAVKLAWGMIGDIREGKWGIDILALMAIVSTILVREYWAAIVIVLMLTGGEALEDYANHRATRELSALLERAPRVTHRLQADGTTVDVKVSDVAIDDRLLIKPGEVIPVDATLEDAVASFDESSLTGESLPVEHKKGDELLSGSVNGDRAITIVALRTADKSQYQQIINLVKAASDSQAPFVRLADRYAVPFTAVSLLIAGVAWFTSGEAIRFAQVLVVATPCPLLIGAPIAFISGMSRAAKHGIIVKNGGILERLARVATVAFDKTGTLTHGEPAVADISPRGQTSPKELLTYAASAEQHSAHILARALQTAAQDQHIKLLPASQVRETTAQGVQAQVGGHTILVGKASFLAKHDIATKQIAQAGKTAVYIARDNEYLGVITFADRVRANSKQTLAALHNLGVRHTLMLTGDNQATANHIAQQLGIEQVHAELLPKDKVDVVKQISDRPVMMVGDGVNDAPVLAAADVGLAMGARGATVASETADVVVLLDDISRTAMAVNIGKHTMRIALQSIWAGIGLSVGLMLLATTGLIPAVVGAGLQEIVDVVVIFNALRAHGSWRKTRSLPSH